MSSSDSVLVDIDKEVARVTLNKPDVHNAFDDAMIATLHVTFTRLDQDPSLRAVVLAANGRSFSAGGDLAWMQRAAAFSEAENRRDAEALAAMLDSLYALRVPTIALVGGPTMGGGVGLVACCDIVIAAQRARFALSEVRLGLIPATVGPYVIAAIGARHARRYFTTAERFDAEQAKLIGLVHEVADDDKLEVALAETLERLMLGGPQAQRQAKQLIRDVAGRPIDAALRSDTAGRIARIRATAEGREGVAAFLEKRQPVWRPELPDDSSQ